MALTLSRWIMAAVVGCATITTIAIVNEDRERPTRVPDEVLPETGARARAWRQYERAYRRWQALARRDSILPTLSSRVGLAADRPMIRSGSGVSPATIALVDRLLRRQRRALGIDSAITPHVVTIVRGPRTERNVPSVWRGTVGFDYFIPASGSGAPCVTVVMVSHGNADSASQRTLNRTLGDPDVTPFLLGPCAFYARFGEPGPAMAEWLAARQYDVVSSPAWSLGRDAHMSRAADLDPTERNWRRQSLPRWDELGYFAYRSDWSSPQPRACLAGELAACEVIIGPERGASPGPTGLASRHALYRIPSGFAAEDYLSDLVSYAGAERFAEVWGSSGSISAAIMTATGSTLGEWTHRWGLAYYPGTLEIGPAVTPGEATAALVLVLGSLAIACAVARVRQSR